MPVVLALASAAVYGVADYCGGRAARSQPPVLVTVSGQFVSLVLIVAAVLAVGTEAPGPNTWLWGALGGASGALGLASFYSALARGVMSTVAPITAVVSLLVPVTVGLAAGERPRPIAYLGMAIAVVGVALVSGAVASRHQRTPRPVLVLALLAGLGFGGLFVCLDRAGDDTGLWPLVAVRITSVTLLATVAVVARIRPVRGGGGLRLAIAAGVLDMLANVFYLEAVRGDLLSIVAVLSALYPVSTVALAMAIDRERVTGWQGVGMGMAALAAALVTLGRV
jgi:drug/metabolite transporter (DMT)-like permease